jgi:hypothetical protein
MERVIEQACIIYFSGAGGCRRRKYRTANCPGAFGFRDLELREASDQALEAYADAGFALYLLRGPGREAHAAGLEQAARVKLSLSRSWLALEPQAEADEPEIEAGG